MMRPRLVAPQTSGPEPRLRASGVAWRRIVALAIVGLAATAAGFVWAPARTWAGALAAVLFALYATLGAAAFAAMNQVSGAGWHVVFKRVPDALASAVPLCGIALVALIPGALDLFPWWALPAEALQPRFSLEALVARTVAAAAVSALLVALWRRESARLDATGEPRHLRRGARLAAVLLLAVGYAVWLLSATWIEALEPHWSSNITGLFRIAGTLSAGVATVTLVTVALRRRGRLPEVSPAHLHDLAVFQLAFSTLWAYMWWSQYLLVWYADLPEEAGYYVARLSDGWSLPFLASLVFGWLLPFVLLLPRVGKRSEVNLLWVSAMILVGQWLDLYVSITPAVCRQHPGVGLAELGPLALIVAVTGAISARALTRRPPTPAGDPYLAESVAHR
ncbi:MAG TPA: hypothetical protein VKZ18_25165 [Polyangia bacterium]|nr:hypothetical protein [Polyangia bacterium]